MLCTVVEEADSAMASFGGISMIDELGCCVFLSFHLSLEKSDGHKRIRNNIVPVTTMVIKRG